MGARSVECSLPMAELPKVYVVVGWGVFFGFLVVPLELLPCWVVFSGGKSTFIDGVGEGAVELTG